MNTKQNGKKSETCRSLRDVLKQAFQSKIIKDGPAWTEALGDRDISLLIYDQEIARNLDQLIRKKYYPYFQICVKH